MCAEFVRPRVILQRIGQNACQHAESRQFGNLQYSIKSICICKAARVDARSERSFFVYRRLLVLKLKG